MSRGVAKFAIKTHGTVYKIAAGSSTEGWRDETNDWPTNPNTGLPWTWAEIDALQAGVELVGDLAEEEVDGAYCTQVFVEVTYEPIPPKLRRFEKY